MSTQGDSGEETKPKVPARVGRYEVERSLGRGGMGCVVLARDSVLGRRVAIKYLRDDLDIPPQSKAALLTRMRHEAQAAASVSHPNIVVLHDMGEDAEVGLYLVFEYVDGPTLRARIAEGTLPLSEVATIARALGSALTAGHAAGVIHRDVKPENVLLSKTGAKLADFGVAHLPDSMITQRNVVLGTPSYTAPEALATADYGPASDQFSLAATLYETIAGARAFAGEDAMDVAKKIALDDPLPIEAIDADPRIVGRINGVLRRGLAKEKIERYATAEDFGAALAIAIESRAITEGPVSGSRTPMTQSRVSSAPIRTPIGAMAVIETPIRPSLIIRKKTHRAQNVFAALGLLVILGLIVFGRHNSDEAPPKDAPSASASTSEPPPAPSTHATHNVVPVVPVKKPPSSPSGSASASPPASASASATASAPAPAPAPASPSASPRRNRVDSEPLF